MKKRIKKNKFKIILGIAVFGLIGITTSTIFLTSTSHVHNNECVH